MHGHNNVAGAVVFPHNIGLGATRNPELVEQLAQATAAEVAATGIHWNYAPVVAVPQDIRWGRTYEGFSEDTALVSEMGVASLNGLQQGDLDAPQTVLATPKHFVGDGGTVWGTATTANYVIDRGVTDVDEATLRAIHLPPYIAAIEAGAQNIMVSYSSWGGERMHAQQYLITDVLKGELGFDGFIVSDWAAVDEISSDYYESVVRAINAGIDMNMVPDKYDLFISTLKAAVTAGDVSEARIDDAVRRILRVKFALGLFEQPFYGGEEALAIIGSPEHRALGREAVSQSLVLLQNENQALPLPQEAGLIFVAGEAADNVGIQSGGWTISWQGEMGNIEGGTSILDGIEAVVGPDTQVQYNRFGRFERITDENGDPAVADVGIVVVGETPYAEGQGDRADLALDENQVSLIERMGESSEQLVVVIISGRPLIITEQLPLADAWVAAWLPGTEGAGVADVLFGDKPFTGRLSYTWPRSMEQVEAGTEADDPLYPFGYGLSYE